MARAPAYVPNVKQHARGCGLLSLVCGCGCDQARAEPAAGLRYEDQGRAQRGLNLLKEHITTDTLTGAVSTSR